MAKIAASIAIMIMVFLILFFLRSLSSVLIILMRFIIHIMSIAAVSANFIPFNIGVDGEGP